MEDSDTATSSRSSSSEKPAPFRLVFYSDKSKLTKLLKDAAITFEELRGDETSCYIPYSPFYGGKEVWYFIQIPQYEEDGNMINRVRETFIALMRKLQLTPPIQTYVLHREASRDQDEDVRIVKRILLYQDEKMRILRDFQPYKNKGV
jgi:hypothetical protein